MIPDCTAVLRDIVTEYIGSVGTAAGASSVPLFGADSYRCAGLDNVPELRPVTCSDDELLGLMFAASNGARVRALFHGDTSQHGGDHSSADLALLSHLCFYTQGDPDRMDRIFRRSGLMRPKWNEYRGRLTYGQLSIARATANAADFYEPPIDHADFDDVEPFGDEDL